MCGTLAKDQNRCILTRKKHYNALSRTVDQGNCLAVKEDLPADQVNEVFSFFKGNNQQYSIGICISVEICYPHTTVWKNEKFSLIEKIFREINYLVTS